MSNGIGLELQAKGLNAPRITPDHVEANILKEHYINAGSAIANAEGFNRTKRMYPVNLLTIYVLVLKNGFTVTGESACASPENFDAEIGRKIARKMQSTKFGH